jgi:hypothetical protein
MVVAVVFDADTVVAVVVDDAVADADFADFDVVGL